MYGFMTLKIFEPELSCIPLFSFEAPIFFIFESKYLYYGLVERYVL